MNKTKGEIWFLASCIELYKSEKGVSGQEAYKYLRDTGALSFVIDCWDGLHMTSPAYIVDSIDEYVETHRNTARERRGT
ncbi:MAG: DUF3791 domain-containing protein [Clostridiales Family XIII bacterium]|jgi:hypothetical protein|nr:DUF3791 domain-containing protein [Clostridiales Family XIII bacterium]